MASAQVLPNSVSSSRKQGHLEAGKRRLEEFRKKKAEGRAKKTASAGQLQSIDVTYDKSPQESELKRIRDPDGASTCEIDSLAGDKLPMVATFDHNKATYSAPIAGPFFPSGTDAFTSTIDDNSLYADLVQKPSKDDESDGTDVAGNPGPSFVNHDYFEEKKNDHIFNFTGPQGLNVYGRNDQSTDVNQVHASGKGNGSNYQFVNHHSFGDGLIQSKENNLKDSNTKDSFSSHAPISSTPVQTELGFPGVSPRNDSNAVHTDANHSNAKPKESVPGIGQYMRAGVDSNGPTTYNTERRKFSSFTDHEPGINGVSWKPTQTYPTDDSDLKNSSNDFSQYSASASPEPGSRRLRPSFLDSLNLSRVSSVPQPSFSQSEKPETFLSKNSEVQNTDVLSSTHQPFIESNNLSTSAFSNTYGDSLNPPISVGDERRFLNWNVMDNSMERKQDENFAALEQHIEDLTQEKFSLQRALDASRTLAESLAAENSSLTESYNQQGTVVNQLKFDLERLQQEIKAQLMAIESFKMEYANAQLECNAADERAKILAAEVIGLEEKALKLRSSELKLERELENTNAEITSFKKKILSLEKDRQDLQHTIDALQEEKKLLQLKLRKASTSGKSIDFTKTPSVMVEVSTSTEDLDAEDSNEVYQENSNGDAQNTSNHEMQGLSSISLFPAAANNQSHLSDVSVAIPPDQLRTIDNINALISELAIEKDELTRSLASESSHRLKLQELNKELSRKLEVQTQRLELLTAQSMANGITPARSTDSQPVHDSTSYTDEGDEVVERVLGWIMKLFPGGPSKRRTSKLL